jgi:hypothetical protein
MRTVEQLDRRRHEALDVGLQLRRHLRQVAAAGAVLLVVATGSVAMIVHRMATSAERRRRARWRLAGRFWRHPEKALRSERRPWWAELGRSVFLSLATTAIVRPAREVGLRLWAEAFGQGQARSSAESR